MATIYNTYGSSALKPVSSNLRVIHGCNSNGAETHVHRNSMAQHIRFEDQRCYDEQEFSYIYDRADLVKPVIVVALSTAITLLAIALPAFF